MSFLFHEILYRPLFNALIFLYETIAFGDLGVAIIILTIIIRFIFYPLFYKTFKHQAIFQRIQPEIKQIQEKHKDNRNRQAEEMMALWKKHKVNPFSSFLLLLVQLPVLIALYQVFRSDFFQEIAINAYSFIPQPETLNTEFLGLLNLTKPNILIVGLAVISQYFQGKLALSRKKTDAGQASPAEKVSRQMVFIGPAFAAIFLFNLSAAIGIYWATTSLFSLIQQIVINRQLNHGTLSNTTNETH